MSISGSGCWFYLGVRACLIALSRAFDGLDLFPQKIVPGMLVGAESEPVRFK